MSEPIQVNNEDVDTIEVSSQEYEAIIAWSKGIAEQNALFMSGIKSVSEQIAETYNVNAQFIADLLRQMLGELHIVVQVPEQPPAVINLPEERKKKVTIKFSHDPDGRIKSAEGTIE